MFLKISQVSKVTMVAGGGIKLLKFPIKCNLDEKFQNLSSFTEIVNLIINHIL